MKSYDTSRSPSTLIPRVISPSYSSHDHAVVCHEYDILPAHDQRTVLKKSCVQCWWVSNACCDILLRRERSRDNFLVDRLSGLPRITEYLLSMLCIPWYEIDLMLRLTWTQKLTFYFVSLPTENLNSVATLLTHWSFQPAFTWVLSPLPLLSYPIRSLPPSPLPPPPSP